MLRAVEVCFRLKHCPRGLVVLGCCVVSVGVKALGSVFRRQCDTTVVGVGCTIVPVSKELVLIFGVDMHVDRTRAGSKWASPVAARSVGTL